MSDARIARILRDSRPTRVDSPRQGGTVRPDERHAKVAAPLASPRLVARGGLSGCPSLTASRSVRASVVASVMCGSGVSGAAVPHLPTRRDGEYSASMSLRRTTSRTPEPHASVSATPGSSLFAVGRRLTHHVAETASGRHPFHPLTMRTPSSPVARHGGHFLTPRPHFQCPSRSSGTSRDRSVPRRRASRRSQPVAPRWPRWPRAERSATLIRPSGRLRLHTALAGTRGRGCFRSAKA